MSYLVINHVINFNSNLIFIFVKVIIGDIANHFSNNVEGI